jgi:hypothetical protein
MTPASRDLPRLPRRVPANSSDLDTATNNANMSDVLNELCPTPETARLNRSSGGVICDPRPGHTEHSPSFSVSHDGKRWLWKRHGGDGAGGNVFNLLEHLGYTKQQAARFLLERAGLESTTPRPSRAPAIQHAPIAEKSASKLEVSRALLADRWPVPALEARGFTLEGAQACGLALASNGDTLIPITDPTGAVIALKKRAAATDAKPRYTYLEGGTGTPAWSSSDYGQTRAVLIVEGELNGMIAHLALEQAGIGIDVQGIAGTSGKPHAHVLEGRSVLVYADGDTTGLKARDVWVQIALEAGAKSVKVLEALQDLEDFCDIAGQNGLEALGAKLQELIGDAQEITVQDDGEQWPEHQPLPAPPSVSTMPPEMLPESLRAWINDAARFTCSPLEIVAANAICAASGVIGASITVNARTGFYVTPNLWGAGVASSGSMKSALLKSATEPTRALEEQAERETQEQSEDHELELSRAQRQHEILEKSYQDGKPAKGKHSSVATLEEVKAAKREVQKLEATKPTERTYTTANSTHEALGMLLEQNQKGVTLVRDEAAPFVANMAREDMVEARGFFNAGWDGSVPYTYHRVTRARVHLPRVCIAFCGMMQPKLLDELIARMLADPMQNDGFLQRFQLLVYPDTYPQWTPPEQQAPPTPNALEDAVKVFEYLDALERYEDGKLKPRLLKFSDEAQAEFNTWHDSLERDIRPGGKLETDSAFKSWYAKTKSLCVSLAAIFHLCELATMPNTGNEDLEPITLDALNNAFDWVEFLTEHARKVYALELDPDGAAARAVAELLLEGGITDGETAREVKRRNRAKAGVIDAGLLVLEQLGWVRIEEVRASERGGRVSEIIQVHPDLRKGGAK